MSMGEVIVAVDIDEVLGQFLAALVSFHNDTYSSTLRVSDFSSYIFRHCWGGDEESSTAKVQAFLGSRYFLDGIPVVPGARDGLERLRAAGFRLVVVTSRQLQIEAATVEWLKQEFGDGLFDQILFGNHWGVDGRTKRSKREMCESLGAHYLIDDSIDYAQEVTAHDNGVRVLLFDWENNYGWNKTSEGTCSLSHRIRRVLSWDEICEVLLHDPEFGVGCSRDSSHGGDDGGDPTSGPAR